MRTGWTNCSISDFCEIKYGKALKSEDRVDGACPVYGSNGIVGYHNEALVNRESIVLGRKGSIGEAHFSTVPFWPIDTTYYVEVNSKKAYQQWVFRLLKTLNLKNLNKSAAVPGLNRNDVYRINISLPPISDQIRIATLLIRAEKLIAKRKESIKALDELLKSTFLEMFGDPVRNEKGWEKNRIDEIADTRLGKMRDKQFITGKYLKYYLGNSDVRWFSFNFDKLEQMDFEEDEQSKFSLQYGDLLVCEGGEIGRCAIWKCEKEDVYFQKALHRVRVDVQIIKQEYLQYVFLWYAMNAGFKNVTSKATIAHLTGEKLKETTIPVPPLPLQTKFTAIVQKVESLKSKYTQSLTSLENLYASLSQQAFKGDLDLSKVPVTSSSFSAPSGQS